MGHKFRHRHRFWVDRLCRGTEGRTGFDGWRCLHDVSAVHTIDRPALAETATHYQVIWRRVFGPGCGDGRPFTSVGSPKTLLTVLLSFSAPLSFAYAICVLTSKLADLVPLERGAGSAPADHEFESERCHPAAACRLGTHFGNICRDCAIAQFPFRKGCTRCWAGQNRDGRKHGIADDVCHRVVGLRRTIGSRPDHSRNPRPTGCFRRTDHDGKPLIYPQDVLRHCFDIKGRRKLRRRRPVILGGTPGPDRRPGSTRWITAPTDCGPATNTGAISFEVNLTKASGL